MRATPDKNLALDLVRVTEAGALAAALWAGRGDKNSADGAAVEAMREALAAVAMDGIVVIGEGEKDEAPMLFNGEKIGNGTGFQSDIAVDPIDGTTLTAKGRPGAVSVIALAERGAMFNPGPCVYMEKLAVGPAGRGAVDLTATYTENLQSLAKRLGKTMRELGVVILDRDRHDHIVEEVREAGARILSISDGDVAGAIATAWPASGADILFGIGGTPEGVIAAAALKGLGGEIQGRLWPRSDEERAQAIAEGYDLNRVLKTEDLVAGDDGFFSMTAITDGEFLDGVRYFDFGATTHSMVLRAKTGTVRTIETIHRHDKNAAFSTAGL